MEPNVPITGNVWVLIVNGAVVGVYDTKEALSAAVVSIVATSPDTAGNLSIGWATGTVQIPYVERPYFGSRGGGAGVAPDGGRFLWAPGYVPGMPYTVPSPPPELPPPPPPLIPPPSP